MRYASCKISNVQNLSIAATLDTFHICQGAEFCPPGRADYGLKIACDAEKNLFWMQFI